MGGGGQGVAGATDGSSSDDGASSGGLPLPMPDGTTTSGAAADSTDTGIPVAGSSSTGDAVDDDESDGTSTTGPVTCTARDWWDSDWRHRRTLVLDNEDVSDTLQDFPVLVRLNSNRIGYAQTQDDGADIRFVAGGQVLAHEIEAWDEAGDSFVWLKIPELPEEGETPPPFHMYYGNDAVGDGSEPAEVWTNGYTSVHHMGTMADSTVTGHDGIPIGGPTVTAGPAGPATSFDGVDDHILLPDEADYDYGNSLTVEVLLRVESFTVNHQAIVTKGDDAWRLHRDEDGSTISFGTTGFFGSNDTGADSSIADGLWHGVAVSLGGDRKRPYVDGVREANELYLESVDETDHPVMIGENASATGRFFHGDIDEVRISGTGRSQAWLETSHRAMLDLGVVLYGALEDCAG